MCVCVRACVRACVLLVWGSSCFERVVLLCFVFCFSSSFFLYSVGCSRSSSLCLDAPTLPYHQRHKNKLGHNRTKYIVFYSDRGFVGFVAVVVLFFLLLFRPDITILVDWA